MNDIDAWRTPQFRQRVIKGIEDAVVKSGGGASPRPPADMEGQAYQKAKSKEEYLNLVSKVILYIRETANQKRMNMAGVQPQQDPINALQSMAKVPGAPQQGMLPQGPAGGMGMPAGPGGMPQQAGMMQRGPAGYQGYPHRPMAPGMHGPSGYGGPMAMNQPNMGGQPGMGPQAMGQPGMGQPSMQAQFSQMGGMRQPMPQNQYAPAGLPFSSGHSPATMSANSPAMMPSPSHGIITPSPGPRPMQVPSPANINLHTPQSGPVPSPADNMSNMSMEERLYLDKLKKLQKYVEPLKRVINKMENDNDRLKDNNKMKNLLNILTDPNKRVPMETLTKCQNVLEKLDLDFRRPVSVNSVEAATTLKPGQHMCQNLINRVAQHIKQPLFNHTLNRTFGPAVDALHGAPIRAPSPPRKRRRNDEPDLDSQEDGGVSDLLQGEIARLHQRFSVDLDPMYHNQSSSVHLLCKLEDKNLPSVPPLAITVPENYPDTSPLCQTHTTGYDTTPFLQRVQKTLASHIHHMPGRYSVTALLNIWEMSVRKAGSNSAISA